MRNPRSLLAALLALAALLLGLGYWFQQHQTAKRRMAAWRQVQADLATRDELDKLVTLEGGRLTLAEFAEQLTKASGLRVQIDEKALVAMPQPHSPQATKVLVPTGTLPLESALWLALNPVGLEAVVASGTLVIRDLRPAQPERRLTVVYPLPQPEPDGMNEASWHSMLIGYANSPGCTIAVVPGALVIVTTEGDHRRIRRVIDAVCNLRNSQPQPVVLPLARGDMEQRIRAALEHAAEIEFVETPLVDAAIFLADRHNIPVILCVPELQAAGVNMDAPVTKSLKGITLRSALRLLLKELDLTFVVKNDALFITTPDDAESRLSDVAYPVHDLLEAGNAAEYAGLMNLIDSTIAPASWDNVGGPGSLRQGGAGWLLVSQTSEVHEQVRELLDRLRQALAADSSVPISLAELPANSRIRDALNQRLPLQFKETPLKEAVQQIQQALRIPIVLNAKTLAGEGVNIDRHITADWPAGRAALQIELILEQLGLTYVVRDEVVQITTTHDAKSQLETRLFNVRPLLATPMTPEHLCGLLANVVDQPSWDIVGGPGSQTHYRGLLLVSQTHPNLEEVEQLLLALQTHCLPNPGARPTSAPNCLLTNPHLQSLDALLDRQTPVTLPALPVLDGLNRLASDCDLPIVPQRKGLVWLDTKMPEIRAASPRQALDELLATPGLDWFIREHIISVMHPREIDRFEDVRLYWVGDLAARSLPADALRRHLRNGPVNLVEGAAQTIDPDWLVVRASQPSHRRIEAWLNEQRTK